MNLRCLALREINQHRHVPWNQVQFAGVVQCHSHALLMVDAANFRTGSSEWVSQPQWIHLWKRSLRIDYSPSVRVNAVRNAIDGAREALKYSLKLSDMIADPDWLIEMTKQVRRKRFIASGGLLKNVLREDQETQDDLMLQGR